MTSKIIPDSKIRKAKIKSGEKLLGSSIDSSFAIRGEYVYDVYFYRNIQLHEEILSAKLKCEINTEHGKTSPTLECKISPEYIKHGCMLNLDKITIDPYKKYDICHNPDRLFDCSLLSLGDKVLGTSIGIKGKKGEVTLLKYTDKGDWRELKAIEVTFDDGTIGNPYPNQLVRII